MLELTPLEFKRYNGASAPKIIDERVAAADPPGDFIIKIAEFVWGVLSPHKRVIIAQIGFQ